MRIKKTTETTPLNASVVNVKNNSTTDAYSCNEVNNLVQDVYSTNEVKTNKVWIDGKPIYRKVYTASYTAVGTNNINISDLSFDYIQITNFNVLTGEFIITVFGDNKINAWINKNSQQLVYVNDSTWANTTFTATLEYTKTTD